MATLKITPENKHRYIDDGGNLTVPKSIQILDCSHNNLTSLIVPEGIKELWCHNNKLTSLIVPKGVQELWCSGNKLTSLIVPKGIKELYCYDNKLTCLDVPEGIQKLWCHNNKLTSLIAPKGIKKLSCSDNKLIYVNVPESLEYIDITDNKDLVYPPKEHHSKLTKEIVEWCKENEIPQRLFLSEKWEERWNIIKLMYVAHYKKDSESDFNKIPVEVITGVIARYVLA